MVIRLSHLASFALLAAVPACGDDGGASPDAGADAVPDPGPAARARFRAVFEEQRFTDLPAAITELEAADAARPGDPDTVLLLGLANLWGIAEVERDPAQAPQAPARGAAALQRFQEVRQLRPADARVFGWMGGALIGAGQATNNPELVEQGLASIEAGVAAYPEFNLFVHALVMQRFPVGSPELASAVDAYFDTLDLCFHTTIDRANPDATPFLGLATETGPERVCWNDPYALHNFEGYFLHMGDALVKAGQRAAARRSYQNALIAPGAATWPYRTMAEERLSTVDTRADLYVDGDLANDPRLVGETDDQCGSCHAR